MPCGATGVVPRMGTSCWAARGVARATSTATARNRKNPFMRPLLGVAIVSDKEGLPQLPLRQRELVGLVGRRLRGHAGVPGRNRLLAWRVGGLERLPHLVDAIVEQVADEQVRQRAAHLRVLLDHVSEAEAVVVLADEPPHAVDADVESRPPLAQLRGGGVVV